MIFLKDQEYARLPDSSSQSWEKLGVLKVGFEHHLIGSFVFFEARFKTKNTYVDEVIQQAVKKKIVPAD